MNKKYAVFGAAAVIAVAGVIYFGTSANQQASVANVANKLSGPVIPIDEPMTPTTPVMTEFQWRKLCRDKQPHIRVTSPNGGEVYQADQMVNLKWKSCNLSQDARINGGLLENIPGSGNMSDVRIQFSNNASWSSNITNNDGREVFRISPAPMNGPLVGGKIYEMYLTVQDSNPSITDESDNTFTINTPDPWVALCADGKPHIQVLSPNGGETYYAGQQVNVKWRSCFSNRHPNGTGDDTARVTLISTQPGISANVLIPHISEGPHAAVVTLPTNFPPYVYGNLYKMKVDYIDNLPTSPTAGQLLATDDSNNTFAIKDNSVQVDVCWNIPGIQTTVPSGMVTDGSGNCVPGGATSPNGGGTTISAWDALCADGQPHIQVISPNGGESYQAGKHVPVTWKSCNPPANSTVLFALDQTGTGNYGLNVENPILAPGASVGNVTANDGQDVMILPTPGSSGYYPNFYTGSNFKVHLYLTPYINGVLVDDTSNDFFKITN